VCTNIWKTIQKQLRRNTIDQSLIELSETAIIGAEKENRGGERKTEEQEKKDKRKSGANCWTFQ